MTNFFSLTGRVLFTGVLLSSCSPSTAPADSLTAPAAAETADTDKFGVRVDSLAGIPGHRFGEPLSAFPGLESVPSPEAGLMTYTYFTNDARRPGWFAKHPEVVRYVYYQFHDGRFAAFQAIAQGPNRAALRAEAAFLFGPGKQDATGVVRWDGARVLAAQEEGHNNNGPSTTLFVQDRAARAAVDATKAAKLKAENAPDVH